MSDEQKPVDMKTFVLHKMYQLEQDIQFLKVAHPWLNAKKIEEKRIEIEQLYNKLKKIRGF